MMYSNGVVSVDHNFARFGSKSYAIGKINTVDVQSRRPYGAGGAGVMAAIAAICVLCGMNAIQSQGTQGGGIVWIILGVGLGAVAHHLWKRSKIVEYQLFLMTSSSSAQAYTTRDEDEIIALREAIEEAMSRELSMQHRHEFTMRRNDEPEPIDLKPAKASSRRERLLRPTD